jgi:hypothetical protein
MIHCCFLFVGFRFVFDCMVSYWLLWECDIQNAIWTDSCFLIICVNLLHEICLLMIELLHVSYVFPFWCIQPRHIDRLLNVTFLTYLMMLFQRGIVHTKSDIYIFLFLWSRNCLPFRSTSSSCYSIFRFMCMFCRSLFVFLYFFFWPLFCLFFFGFWLPLWYLQTLFCKHFIACLWVA